MLECVLLYKSRHGHLYYFRMIMMDQKGRSLGMLDINGLEIGQLMGFDIVCFKNNNHLIQD